MRAASRPAATGRDRRKKSRGQGLVEFALVAPVLLLLLLITLDFGRMFMSYVTLNNVARVAANFGSVNPANFTGTPNTTTYNTIVNHEAAGLNCPLRDGPSPDFLNPPIPTYPNGSSLGDDSVVQLTCDFTPLTPLIGAIIGAPFPISAEARFPVRTGAIANIGGSSTLPPPGAPFAAFTITGVTGGTVDGSGNVTGTPPVTVTVTDGSVNAQTYDWDWGDSTTHDFTAAPLPHPYTGSSTYTLTLTITNSQGSASFSRTVSLGGTPTPPPTAPPPVLAFYGSPQGSLPQVDGGGPGGQLIKGSYPSTTVVFTNQTTNGNTYSWNFGDGSSPSTQTSPTHSYTATGVYDVTLTVTDPTGTTPLPKVGYVTIGCVVPTFAGKTTDQAAGLWAAAGFSGTITYQPSTASGGSNTSQTPPTPPKTIEQQVGPGGGLWVPPIDPHGNNPWCGSDVKLRYTP